MTRRPFRARFALVLPLTFAVTFVLAAVVLSCADDPTPQPCTDIPQGGCPLSHGVACEDPECVAVYACSPGNVWTLDHTCPPHEAGAPREDASVDGPPPRDATTDGPPGANGGPGCGMLETPDCPLGVALACPSSAGCCDCEDLFVCKNGGWEAWGTCTLADGIRENP